MAADLATRVEREPPSRELDAEIHRAIGRLPAEWSASRILGACDVPHYTTSRDAAHGPMPARWLLFTIEELIGRDGFIVKLERWGVFVMATAPTEAQARIAAVLRALAKERGDG